MKLPLYASTAARALAVGAVLLAQLAGCAEVARQCPSAAPTHLLLAGRFAQQRALAAALDTEATFIVAREPTGDGIEAMPVDTSSIPNDHWGYAITWFSLAAVWAGMTGYLLWRIRQRGV